MKNLGGGDFLETLGAPLYNDVLNAFFRGVPENFEPEKGGVFENFERKNGLSLKISEDPPPFFWGGSSRSKLYLSQQTEYVY